MQVSPDLDHFERVVEQLMSLHYRDMLPVIKAHGLGPSQFFALVTIAERKPLRMSPLAEALGLTVGAASTLIDRMVQTGLISREPDPVDRRAVSVSLTPQGERLLAEITHHSRDHARRMVSSLDAASRRNLLVGLQALVELFERP